MNITIGNFEKKQIVEIGITSKGTALNVIEDMGYIKGDVLKIGDQGDKFGNDFTLLKSDYGFSVNEVSSHAYECFPVMKHNGATLEFLLGSKATAYLLKNFSFKTI